MDWTAVYLTDTLPDLGLNASGEKGEKGKRGRTDFSSGKKIGSTPFPLAKKNRFDPFSSFPLFPNVVCNTILH